MVKAKKACFRAWRGVAAGVLACALAACGSGAGEQAGAEGSVAGKSWRTTEPRAGGEDSFQGAAYLTLADLPSDGEMPFRDTRVTLRCPANWGNESNQQWSASVDLPISTDYENRASGERGSMAIDVDGKKFSATQFSRSSFNLLPDQAEPFRDAVAAGKKMSLSVKTLDGKSGTVEAALPGPDDALKGYFAKHCA